MKKWSKPLAILTLIGLVVAPIAADRSEGLRTRWALARVAVLADQGDPDAETELAKIVETLPKPEAVRDYWLVKLKIALKNDSPQEALEVAKRALVSIPGFTNPILIAKQTFYDRADYQHSLEAVEFICKLKSQIAPLESEDLNELAYLRSLSLKDLDQALVDIDEALKKDPTNAGLLDTRAWVLFQMGRLTEALDDANEAVDRATRAYDTYQANWDTKIQKWLSGRARVSPTQGTLTEHQVGRELWSLGALRFHRGRILEALGRTDEAQQDWQWLDDHRLPRDDRLR